MPEAWVASGLGSGRLGDALPGSRGPGEEGGYPDACLFHRMCFPATQRGFCSSTGQPPASSLRRKRRNRAAPLGLGLGPRRRIHRGSTAARAPVGARVRSGQSQRAAREHTRGDRIERAWLVSAHLTQPASVTVAKVQGRIETMTADRPSGRAHTDGEAGRAR